MREFKEREGEMSDFEFVDLDFVFDDGGNINRYIGGRRRIILGLFGGRRSLECG